MSIELNGTSGYLRIPYTAAMAVTGRAVTLSAWIRPAALTGEIISRHTSASTANCIYILDIANGSLRMGIGASGFLGAISTQRASGGTLATGRWYHVAGTYDGTAIRTYLNGVEVGNLALTSNMLTSSTPLSIGAHFNGSSASNYYRGTIEDVRKYARALSANEIMTMHTVRGRDGTVQGLVTSLPLTGRYGQGIAANTVLPDIGPSKFAPTAIATGMQFVESMSSIRLGI